MKSVQQSSLQEYFRLRFVEVPYALRQLQNNMNDSLKEIDESSPLYDSVRLQQKQMRTQQFEQVHIEEEVRRFFAPQIDLLKAFSHTISSIGEKYAIKKKQTNLINEDSVSQFSQSSMSFINNQLIQVIAVNQLPAPQKNCHIFSACLLDKGRQVGLCLGSQEPFLVYDLQSGDVKTIKIEKQGIFDALELPGTGGILIGCNRTIRIISETRVLYDHFPQSPITPSRLIFREGQIFGTDCLTQLGTGGSYCSQWSITSDEIVNYRMEGKSTGAMSLDGDHLVAADINRKLYVWKMGQPAPIKVLKCEEVVTSLVTNAPGVLMGAGRTKFYIWNWTKRQSSLCSLDYEKKVLNAISLIDLENHFLVGDNSGYVTVIDTRNKTQIELLKLRSKVMKLQQKGRRFVAASYEGSFCVFDLKLS